MILVFKHGDRPLAGLMDWKEARRWTDNLPWRRRDDRKRACPALNSPVEGTSGFDSNFARMVAGRAADRSCDWREGRRRKTPKSDPTSLIQPWEWRAKILTGIERKKPAEMSDAKGMLAGSNTKAGGWWLWLRSSKTEGAEMEKNGGRRSTLRWEARGREISLGFPGFGLARRRTGGGGNKSRSIYNFEAFYT